MLAPVSMHVVLKATGGIGFCLINDVLFCQGLPPLRHMSFLLEESFFKGPYPGTHCQGACVADLNWRPANLACRPLNLAHLVE